MATEPSAEFASPEGLWTVGQVASLLGVPSVTLRSWERRYQVGPSQRSAGQHRRYNRRDVERLELMRNLIRTGKPAREAALLSAATNRAEHQSADLWAEREARHLVDLASTSRPQSLADELRSCLSRRGLRATWNLVVRPALRMLEARYVTAGDCIDIELVLTQAVTAAVDRHTDVARPSAGDAPHPVLLTCCPGERHHLPLSILHGVLLDLGVPTILLGPGLPSEAVIAAVGRMSPSVVVMWSLVRRRGLMEFHSEIAAAGVEACAAGPGWPRSPHPVTTLDEAADRISGLWFTATSASARKEHRSEDL